MPYDKKMRILVVDDFGTSRKIVKNILKKLGYENIVEAEDGKDAFEKLSQGGFDFIITDWNMPVVSGLDLLKKVRGDDRFKNIPVLMVTAEAEKDQVLEAVKAGASNYVVKPFTPDALKEKLDNILVKLGASPS